MSGDVGHAAQRLGTLLGAAKIERAPEPRPQHRDVVVGQMAEMIGAEELPPAHDAAVAGGIAAEIAKIAGAGEVEMADRGFDMGLTVTSCAADK